MTKTHSKLKQPTADLEFGPHQAASRMLPDRVITLVTGEKIIVRETTEQVLERVIIFRKTILAGLAGGPVYSPSNFPPAGHLPAEGSGTS